MDHKSEPGLKQTLRVLKTAQVYHFNTKFIMTSIIQLT